MKDGWEGDNVQPHIFTIKVLRGTHWKLWNWGGPSELFQMRASGPSLYNSHQLVSACDNWYQRYWSPLSLFSFTFRAQVWPARLYILFLCQKHTGLPISPWLGLWLGRWGNTRFPVQLAAAVDSGCTLRSCPVALRYVSPVSVSVLLSFSLSLSSQGHAQICKSLSVSQNGR